MQPIKSLNLEISQLQGVFEEAVKNNTPYQGLKKIYDQIRDVQLLIDENLDAKGR
ncbi:MAG: hypothetical protein ABI415_10630 [Flavitalea sp.]